MYDDLCSPIDLQNKEPAHTKEEAGQALIQRAVAHAGGNWKLQMSANQFWTTSLGVEVNTVEFDPFVQRIPTFAAYLLAIWPKAGECSKISLKNELRKQTSKFRKQEEPGDQIHTTSRLSRPAL